MPLPDGKYNSDRERLWILDGSLVGTDLGSDAAAIAEHEARELRFLAANGTLLTIEYSDRLRRATDKTVAEWIDGRARDDGKPPSWHLRALSDIATYLADHDLARSGEPLAALDVQLGAPASDDDIDALAAERTTPIPDSLRALWRAHGRASWKLDDHGMRLLGPREVLARRDAARALGARYLARLTPPRAEAARPLLEHLDVIVETLDGTPVTVLADVEREDGRVFTHAYDTPDDLWWEVSLSWMLATRLVGDLAQLLVARAPVLSRLMVGQRRSPAEQLAYLEKGTAFFELALDPDAGILSTRFGKIGTTGTASVVRLEPAVAAKQFAKKLAEKTKGGYRAPRGSAKKPSAKKPSAKKPSAKKSSPKKPSAKKPSAKKPSPKKPSAKKPSAKKPSAKKPTKTPAAKKSSSRTASAKASTAKKPSAKKPR